MLLGEGDDGGVSGGIQEKGYKVYRLPGEGILDDGDEEGVGR